MIPCTVSFFSRRCRRYDDDDDDVVVINSIIDEMQSLK
jgi:hypothetical protein